jgi:hypothetical protein
VKGAKGEKSVKGSEMRTLMVGVLTAAMCGATAWAGEAAKPPTLADQAPNTWVKRSPLPGGPPSPRLGYEASWDYDPEMKRMIRWGAHDPGGGGPQLTETWTFDPETAVWEFKRTNNNPPGNCCCRENVFNPLTGVFTRFSYPAFGHGWFWDRSRWLREDSVWTYSLKTNTWTNMRPGKEPALNVGKPAFWDPNHQMIWVYDTKLRAYDPHTNTWHTVNESKGIGKRTYAAMELDPERNKIVLFGDHYQSDPRTWVYDIAKDEWVDMQPAVLPPGIRSCPTMVYDSRNRKFVMISLAGPWDPAGAKAALKTVVDRDKAAASNVQPAEVEQKVKDALAPRGTFLSQLEFNQLGDLVVATRDGRPVRVKDVARLEFAPGENPRRMETWTYDLGTNTWTRMNPPVEPDYSGTRGRLMRYLADKNVVILEGRTDTEQQIWTYRLANPPPPAPTFAAPQGLTVTTLNGGQAELTWQTVAGAAGYHVYYATADVPWKTVFARRTPEPIKAATFQDSGLKTGTVNYYYVTAVGAGGQEGARSLQVRTQPPIILKSRVDVLAKDNVRFTWEASPQPDVAGYVVERAVLRPISGAQKISSANWYSSEIPLAAMVEKAALGPFERLTPKPDAAATFPDDVDLSVPKPVTQVYWQPYFAGGDGPEGDKKNYDMTRPGCPFTIYAYRVRAVNRLGVESGPSPYQMTVPNEVENFYGKEEGKAIHLKWDISPHQGIQGYYVFRLNERYPSDPKTGVVLLTPTPIKETTFTDPDVGGRTRRYYVVVVDALGQQGLPSHPVWANREWKAHYAPWDPPDGWHQ